MTRTITTATPRRSKIETSEGPFDNWFDPIEANLCDRIHEFIQAMLEAELDAVLSRPRYARRAARSPDSSAQPVSITGHRPATTPAAFEP